MQQLATRVVRDGVAALVIDYGAERPSGRPTLQALRSHARHEVLEDPGTADLTAHVDFAALARTAREAGAAAYGPVTQGMFLKALGIDARARILKRNATAQQGKDIESAIHRLTDGGQMGSLFKVMAVLPPDAPPPAGFPA
jgi:NADH dehydrogenase [ubiquinone] 1 alpha subcomplex assembly factor 7